MTFTREQLITAARSLCDAPASATVYAPGDECPKEMRQIASRMPEDQCHPQGWIVGEVEPRKHVYPQPDGTKREHEYTYEICYGSFKDGDVVLRALILKALGAFDE